MAQTTREITTPPYTSRITLEAGEDVTSRVLHEIAGMLGLEPTDLPDVNGSVDPDALDGLFDPRVDGTDGFVGSVSFEYGSYRVRIEAPDTGTPCEDAGQSTIVLTVSPLRPREC